MCLFIQISLQLMHLRGRSAIFDANCDNNQITTLSQLLLLQLLTMLVPAGSFSFSLMQYLCLTSPPPHQHFYGSYRFLSIILSCLFLLHMSLTGATMHLFLIYFCSPAYTFFFFLLNFSVNLVPNVVPNASHQLNLNDVKWFCCCISLSLVFL